MLTTKLIRKTPTTLSSTELWVWSSWLLGHGILAAKPLHWARRGKRWQPLTTDQSLLADPCSDSPHSEALRGRCPGDCRYWFLTRAKVAPPELLAKMRAVGKSLGYDNSVLLPVEQKGCTYDGSRDVDQ